MKIESYLAKDEAFLSTTKPHNLPIYPTSSFKFESVDQGIELFSGKEKGHVYGRYGNPTMESVARKIMRLEMFREEAEGFGIMVSSGMAAISTLAFAELQAGDKLITQNDLYGGTTMFFNSLLNKLGVKVIKTDFGNLEKLEKLLKADSKIKMLYYETPANATMQCIDLSQIAKFCGNYKVKTAVDSTFCTPYIQQPLKLGFDYVVHSTTKFINGHGNAITGVIIGKNESDYGKVWDAMKLLGTNCNPFDAWLVNNGMKTLALRMDRHSSNAFELAQRLEKLEEIEFVNYPFLSSNSTSHIARKQMKYGGGMLSFGIKGGIEAGMKFMNAIKISALAPTLGNIDSLIVHPASMSHRGVDKEVREANGITDGLIRMSVGIEDVEDLYNDLKQALEKV